MLKCSSPVDGVWWGRTQFSFRDWPVLREGEWRNESGKEHVTIDTEGRHMTDRQAAIR